MNDGEMCICGSGGLYELCCKPYIDKTLDDYFKELKKKNVINAYHIAVGMLSNYLEKVKKHTNIVIKENPKLGKMLVQIDSNALDELMKRIYAFSYYEIGDWDKRLESIKGLVDANEWKEKCIYYQLIYLTSMDSQKVNKNRIKELSESVKAYNGMDENLLMLLRQLYPITGSLTKILNLDDMIINKTNDPIIKLKYKFDKAYYINII